MKKILLFLFLLIIMNVEENYSQCSDIATDNISLAEFNGTSALTTQHTCTGTDRILIVGVVRDVDYNSGIAVTYNNIPLTFIIGENDETQPASCALFYLISPPTGTHTLSVNTQGVNGFFVSAVSFTGVDQLNPIDNLLSLDHPQTTTFSNPELTFTTNSDNTFIVDIVHPKTGPFTNPYSNQTIINTGINNRAGMSVKELQQAGTTTIGWQVAVNSSYEWVYAAVSLKKASSLDISASILSNVTCFNGSNGSVTVDAFSGVEPYSFEWNTGGINNMQTINNLVAGTYTVTVTDDNGCIGTDSVLITEPTDEDYNISFSSTQQLFTSPPFAVQFTNTTPNSSSYDFTWDFGDGSLLNSNGTTVFHVYQCDGLYDVSLFATDNITGCTDTTIIEDYIFTLGANPPVPTITQNGANLVSSSNSGNQWYLDGILIPNANQQIYLPIEDGSYTVTVTLNSCSSVSSSYPYSTVGIEDVNDVFYIYPNPTINTLTIEIQTAKSIYQLHDVTGKLLLSGNITIPKFNLDISALSKGIYLLSLFDGENQLHQKIIKD